MSTSEIILNLESISKKYGDVTALRNISLNVYAGEMFGLVGPDGAGKTTAIRIACGLITRNSGSLNILGKDIDSEKKEIQKEIGYLSQKFSLYGDLTVDENIEFFASIHNVSDFKKRRTELLQFTRLIDFRDRLADKLSGGMKQKLALACSLIHKPKIIFLDEPTTGVDPVSRRDFWKILSGLLQEGITIIMSTPYLDEAERCNRVAMMNRGEIIALDTPAKIKNSISREIIEIVSAPVKKAYEVVKNNFDYEVQMFGDRINIITKNYENDLALILAELKSNNIKITDQRRLTPSLENVFMFLIKEAS